MNSNDSENSRRSSLPSTDRLDGFTDAVLAIIVTLMAVEIAPPTAAEVSRLGLADALAEMWPEFFALALSFLLVGQVWVSHHAMWRLIERVDRPIKLVLLLHLLFLSLTPLASELIAEYLLGTPSEQRTSAAVYAGVALASAIFFVAIWLLAWRRGLVSEDLDHQTARAILLRYAAAPVLYGLALALAFVNPRVSIALYVLLIVPYLLPGPGDPNRAAD